MISTNLQMLRKINKYTQEEVAEKINVSRQAVAKWENGDSLPDIDNCVALARLYDITLDNLVNDSEDTVVPIIPKANIFLEPLLWGSEDKLLFPKKPEIYLKLTRVTA